MLKNMKIEKAICRDSRQIQNLYKSILNEHKTVWTVKSVPSIKNLNKTLSDPDTIPFIAKTNKEIVGIVILRRQPGKRNHVGEIGYDVRKGYRNQGIATLLINRILREAKRRGIKSIIAWIASDNKPSINLIKKFCFKEVGRIKNGVSRNDKYYDYILFQNSLISIKKYK